MANKVFRKAFTKEFTGISGECSALEPESGEVNRAVNYEYSVGNSLRGRVGCQTSGSHGFFAIFPYRYTRTQDQYDIVYQVASGTYPNQTAGLSTVKTSADGATIEKLIALNQQVWLLDTMNVTITQTNAGAYTWYSYISGSDIKFKILKDGVSILDTSLGDGITSSTSIYSLLGTIDALADLSVAYTRGVVPPYAVVNGNQNAIATGVINELGPVYRITVNAGHTFQAGDIITFNNNPLAGRFVVSTAATTIDFVEDPTQTTALVNNQILGYLGQPSSNFPISTISSETLIELAVGEIVAAEAQ